MKDTCSQVSNCASDPGQHLRLRAAPDERTDCLGAAFPRSPVPSMGLHPLLRANLLSTATPLCACFANLIHNVSMDYFSTKAERASQEASADKLFTAFNYQRTALLNVLVTKEPMVWLNSLLNFE